MNKAQLENQLQYKEAIESAKRKPGGHIQVPFSPEYTPDVRIYAITTIDRSHSYRSSSRTPAIATTFERAKEIVEYNEGDIWEFSYMLCVIEAIMPNQVYGNVLNETYWYVWDMNENKYIAIETPDAYKNIIGWGIG